MKTLSLASLAVKSIAAEQPTPSTKSSKDLSRAVFDDLLEHDILGFLLSSNHLRKYLAHFSTYAEPEVAQIIKRNICNVDIVDKFHKETLEMFAGAYIPESKCSTAIELMRALDAKYENYAKDLDSLDVRYEVSLKQLESVDLAWQYRNACNAGSPLVSF